MSATIVNTAITAVVALLQGPPAVAPQIERVRLRPLQAGATTAVVVTPMQTEPTDAATLGGQPIAWQTTFAVECYAAAAPGTAADVAVDDLLSAVYARLMADPTLGGTGRQLRPLGVDFDFDADGNHTACAKAAFSIRQTVSPNSLS